MQDHYAAPPDRLLCPAYGAAVPLTVAAPVTPCVVELDGWACRQHWGAIRDQRGAIRAWMRPAWMARPPTAARTPRSLARVIR
jgi:hypothetical protein